MKHLLLLSCLLALPAAGFSETRTYRDTSPSVQRVTTVRTASPSIEVYRQWNHRRDYIWQERRYHWDGGAWIVFPEVYGYRGAYGTSSALQDDVGEDSTPTVVTRTVVTHPEANVPGLTMDVQRQLARRGYYRGPIDGIAGPGTRSAITAFQTDHGIDPSGYMSNATVKSLGL